MYFQLLEVDTEYKRDKEKPSWKLFKGKSTNQLDNVDAVGSPSAVTPQAQLSVPLVESLFMPDFPVRGDIEQQEFEVMSLLISPLPLSGLIQQTTSRSWWFRFDPR